MPNKTTYSLFNLHIAKKPKIKYNDTCNIM